MLSKIELIEYGAKVLAVFDEKVTMQEIIWILENVVAATNEVNQGICPTSRCSRAADVCQCTKSSIRGYTDPQCPEHGVNPPPA